MADFELKPRSVFDAIGGCRVAAEGVTFDEAAPRTLLSLAARKGQADALRSAVAKAFDLDLPDAGQMVMAKGITALWSGPDQWFLSAEGDAHLAKTAKVVADMASVTDQSDGYTALTLAGPRAPDVLMRMSSLDFNEEAFPAGSVARTSMQQISAMIARTGDGPDYLINTPRSTARDFAHDIKVAITAVLARG
ncbi:MAG: sarcosine oxidase subunit gamma family protein [Pseudomonadota bacterium]